MPSIPLLDLRAQYQSIKPEIDAAIQRVLDSAQFILGPEVSALEQEIAAYCGTKYAVGVASGTDALELALRACGIGNGDEVITTAYSFFATAEVIATIGAIPIFVDIELQTYNLDPALVSQAITPRTKAILPVHLYGHPCPMDEIMAIAKRHHLNVIEDCAQAIGATFNGQRVGSFGDAAALSFFPSKNLGAYGDGGMVVTNSATIAEQVRLLRAHGSRKRYWHEVIGKNSRLDELQAAVLRVKLQYLDRWIGMRRQAARWYREGLQPVISRIRPPQERLGYQHVYHQYVICSQVRDQLMQALLTEGVSTQVYYPSTLPSQPALSAFLASRTACLNADTATRELLALPVYPELAQSVIEQICKTIIRNSR